MTNPTAFAPGPTTALQRPLPPDPAFASVLEELERLGRGHLLAYTLACGQLLLERFWGNDPVAFHSKDPGKALSFQRFVTECGDLLAELGQSAEQLRRSVHAHLVWRGLPAVSRDRLRLTHLLELGRCPEPTQRARLALAATEEGWSRLQLRDAVSAALAGRYYDTDPNTPGIQPPAPLQPAGRRPSAARLVTRSERLLPEVQAWQAALAQSNIRRLSGDQRARLAQTLQGLEAQIAAARALLAKP